MSLVFDLSLNVVHHRRRSTQNNTRNNLDGMTPTKQIIPFIL